jgi:hypothetical protein
MPDDRIADSTEQSFVDIEKPSVARAYDWYLGGSCNTAIDREFARRVATMIPAKTMALDNRNYLRRVVTHLIGLGVRQFIDIGSGIPTVGNIHDVAAGLGVDARVVYVDNDPVAFAQSQIVLEHHDRAIAIHADLRNPDAIVGDLEVRDFLDFDQPIALLLIAVLHFIADDDHPAELIATYCNALTPGSYLAISHLTDETAPPGLRSQIQACVGAYKESTSSLVSRDQATLAQWLRSLDVLPPGIVVVPHWNPDDPAPDGPEHELMIGAVAQILR